MEESYRGMGYLMSHPDKWSGDIEPPEGDHGIDSGRFIAQYIVFPEEVSYQ